MATAEPNGSRAREPTPFACREAAQRRRSCEHAKGPHARTKPRRTEEARVRCASACVQTHARTLVHAEKDALRRAGAAPPASAAILGRELGFAWERHEKVYGVRAAGRRCATKPSLECAARAVV